MEFHIADTFTDSLTRLTGDELRAFTLGETTVRHRGKPAR